MPRGLTFVTRWEIKRYLPAFLMYRVTGLSTDYVKLLRRFFIVFATLSSVWMFGYLVQWNHGWQPLCFCLILGLFLRPIKVAKELDKRTN